MKIFASILISIIAVLAMLTPVAASQMGSSAALPKVIGEGPVTNVVPSASMQKVVREDPVNSASFTAADSLAAIADASGRWGVSESWLLGVARCESGLNPYAFNGYNVGLFQFAPGTYWGFAARIGETRSYWNPYASANVAAFMFHLGLSYEWACG